MGNKIVGCALLLGILIFLPEPGDGLAEHGEPCHSNTGCKTKWCHKSNKICGCPSMNNGRHNVLVQFFDQARKKCVTAVGKACTLARDPNDPLPPLECVEHAICVKPRHSPLPDTFGECVCRNEYKMTKHHLCVLPHEFGMAEEQKGEGNANGNYIHSKEEKESTWTPVSKSFSASVHRENYYLICFMIPVLTLLIHDLSLR